MVGGVRPVLTASRRHALARGALCLLGLGLAACAEDAPTPPPPSEGNGTGGTGTTMPGVTLSVRVMALDDGAAVDPLNLAAGQAVALVVTSKPAVARTVRFALLGDALDASLSATDVETKSLSGSGQVVLTAPSEPKAFGVRVTTTDAEPYYLSAAVPSTGVARILANPKYSGGRGITSWTATAWENTTCGDLSGAPPPDSDNVVTSPTFPLPLEVRAGVPLALVVRGGHYVWGCRTVDAAVEGAGPVLDVKLADVPLRLDRSSLRFTLGLAPKEPFLKALAPIQRALIDALDGGGGTDGGTLPGDATPPPDDVTALLDAMQATLRDPSAFRSTRKAEQWDSYVRTALGGGAALGNALGSFVSAGLDAFDTTAAFVGDLTSVPSTTAPDVTLATVFGLSAQPASFTATGSSSWKAQPDDSVLVGFALTFEPGALLLEAATRAALAENTSATDLADAASDALPCKTVAQTLVDHGETATHSTDGCDFACTQALCEKGVRALVGRAEGTTVGSATLTLGLEGTGGFDDAANLTLLNGTWLGELALPPAEAASAGAGTAEPEPVRLEGNFLASTRNAVKN